MATFDARLHMSAWGLRACLWGRASVIHTRTHTHTHAHAHARTRAHTQAHARELTHLEARLGEGLLGGTQAVRIPAAVVELDGKDDLGLTARLPRGPISPRF